MIRHFLATVGLMAVFVGTVAVARAATPALAAGESLTFSVDWAIVTAGEIKIAAKAAPAGSPPGLVVTTTTRTIGPLSLFLKFEAQGEALFDLPSGRLVSTTDRSKQSRKETRTSLVMDYAKAEAKFTDAVEPAKSGMIPMPKGEPLDLIMSLISTRTWDLKPGESRDMLAIFDGEFYELTVHAIGFEDVRTPLGKFKTLVLEPRMEKTPPKGMFKRGSTVRVWVSQDDRKLPVKFRVDFNIGAGVATLIAHEKPSPALSKTP